MDHNISALSIPYRDPEKNNFKVGDITSSDDSGYVANKKYVDDNYLKKPANPSAESAVTMLADGTVGTKLLSEIGGSGKLYKHELTMAQDGTMSVFIFITSSYAVITDKNKIPYDKFVSGILELLNESD